MSIETVTDLLAKTDSRAGRRLPRLPAFDLNHTASLFRFDKAERRPVGTEKTQPQLSVSDGKQD